MRRLNSKIETKFLSNKGNDPNPRTYAAYTPLDHLACYAVAESYDEDVDIQSAKLAVETVLTAFEKSPSLSKRKIKGYLNQANQQILFQSTKNRLKVSIALVVSDYTRMRYAVCGNTKVQILFENMLTHSSLTQTAYQQLLDAGEGEHVDPGQVQNLTQYLGMGKRIRPFISRTMDLLEHSTILLSTGSLWGRISDIEILDAYENSQGMEEFLDNTQELLLSGQERGGIDSYTAAAIEVEKVFLESPEKKKIKIKAILISVGIVVALALIFLIGFNVLRKIDRTMMREVERVEQRGRRMFQNESYAKSLEEYEKAVELSGNLNLYNWQYIDEKRDIIDRVAEIVSILTTIQEGESLILEKNYAEAKKRYEQAAKQAKSQEEESLYQSSMKKLDEMNGRLEIQNLISLGEMYEGSGEYEEAKSRYQEAIKGLSTYGDVELQGEVQMKLFALSEKIKEKELTEAEAKEQQKQEQFDEKVIQIQVRLANANKAVEELKLSKASRLYKEALSIYKSMNSNAKDLEAVYQEIVALKQAIADGKVQKEEEEKNAKLEKAQEWMTKAEDAKRENKKKKAIQYYEKALAIYKALKIWDDQVEKIYEEISALEGSSNTNTSNSETATEDQTNTEAQGE